MNIGYARVSTDEQNLDLQLKALKKAGCKKIYHEKMSGSNDARPELKTCLEFAREGDVLVVWRLDRLARSITHLVNIANDLRKRNVEFRCLNPTLDTSTPDGRFFFNITAAFAELEREINIQRTKAGLAAARERGMIPGRPAIPEDVALRCLALMNAGMSQADTASLMKLGRSTLNVLKVRYADATLPKLTPEDVALVGQIGTRKGGRPVTKLDPDIRRTIIDLLKSGSKITAISKATGVTRSVILGVRQQLVKAANGG
jgi:DNA invertase Pin-like site-specific DNA recombinase